MTTSTIRTKTTRPGITRPKRTEEGRKGDFYDISVDLSARPRLLGVHDKLGRAQLLHGDLCKVDALHNVDHDLHLNRHGHISIFRYLLANNFFTICLIHLVIRNISTNSYPQS